jgi:hypothetical protein
MGFIMLNIDTHMLKEPSILIVRLFFLFIFFSCNEDKKINLNQWIDENKTRHLIYNAIEEKNCNTAIANFNLLNINEFKRKTLLALINNCNLSKSETLYYTSLAFELGVNIKRIDSSHNYLHWGKIESIYVKKNQKFWSAIDTSYFKKIEHFVYLDQKVRYDKPHGSTDFTEELKVDSLSTKFLLDYSENNGFPKDFDPSYFENFRTTINPLILASHSDEKNKIKLLEYAISNAEKGKISWNIPINIMKSFYVVRVDKDEIKPMRFLEFKNDKLQNTNYSLLELYSIKELFSKDMPSKITLYPSKSNRMDAKTLLKNLLNLKNILVKDLKMNKDNIKICKTPNPKEADTQNKKDYLFTFLNSNL